MVKIRESRLLSSLPSYNDSVHLADSTFLIKAVIGVISGIHSIEIHISEETNEKVKAFRFHIVRHGTGHQLSVIKLSDLKFNATKHVRSVVARAVAASDTWNVTSTAYTAIVYYFFPSWGRPIFYYSRNTNIISTPCHPTIPPTARWMELVCVHCQFIFNSIKASSSLNINISVCSASDNNFKENTSVWFTTNWWTNGLFSVQGCIRKVERRTRVHDMIWWSKCFVHINYWK